MKKIQLIIQTIKYILFPPSKKIVIDRIEEIFAKVYVIQTSFDEEFFWIKEKITNPHLTKNHEPFELYMLYIKFIYGNQPRDIIRKNIFKIRHLLHALSFEDYNDILNHTQNMEEKKTEELTSRIQEMTERIITDMNLNPYNYMDDQSYLSLMSYRGDIPDA